LQRRAAELGENHFGETAKGVKGAASAEIIALDQGRANIFEKIVRG
jgi:hypothetical protein